MGEKIIPTEIKKVDKPGKTTFWAITCADGREVTVWKDEIAEVLIANLHQQVEAEIKTSQYNGKVYYNIRAIENAVNQAPTKPTPVINPSLQPTTTNVKDDVGKSIVAQCLVKAVIGSIEPGMPVEIQSQRIEQAVKMYKQALELL